ncbi:SPOR domain-containing protein [Marinobacter sp. JSM 1782161]|uniref:SPOR domain-containing protein n=1 Tax=Marinobacter sp. JSM 1782161 TaxID=2685906 RepID=UPI00140336FA|nr:SPOR domain-containing protein [Marinobacter sp. JSM 1782161]
MKWLIVALLLVNGLLVLAAVEWSPPGALDVAGAEGKLPRVGDLKLASSSPEANPSGDKPRLKAAPVEAVKPEVPRETLASDGDSGAHAEDRHCFTVPGFESRADARAFAKGLNLDDEGIRVEPQREVSSPYHWVLIPPLPGRDAALQRLEELQRGGVDSYLVTEGEYRNAISLGLFESETLASDLNARFQMKNIETVLVNVDRNQISYALVFEASPGQDLEQIARAAERVSGDSELGEKAVCEGVASPNKNP